MGLNEGKRDASRRNFIKKAATIPMIGTALPWLNEPGTLKHPAAKLAADNRYAKLLSKWCQTLLQYQITEIKVPEIYGGLMSPAGARVRGRCFDAILPFLYMAENTGDQQYLQAARLLQKWSKHVSLSDGSWVNEPVTTQWKGTTVFGAITFAESLKHFGHLLNPTEKLEWENRLVLAMEYIYNTISFQINQNININYPISAALAMTMAGELLDNKKYLKRGRREARMALNYFTEANNLLYGEGRPWDLRSPKGCLPVDLGYNVEESLPNLVLYAKITNDEEVLEKVINSLYSHLEFMLPDGGWDNSWGTRNFKWTYWGSRTSDGCQVAYGLLGDKHPVFKEAAYRNLKLLEKTTHEGLLTGGPHFHLHGVPVSIHHTFTHAKALATCLIYGVSEPEKTEMLPREIASGVKPYPDIQTWLIAKGDWRGTVTAYDWLFRPKAHASGGALSMLWHPLTGPLLSASLTEYIQHESDNMQAMFEPDSMPLTPRIETVIDGVTYYSMSDFGAKVKVTESKKSITVISTGNLLADSTETPKKKPLPFSLTYHFFEGYIEIIALVEASDHETELYFVLPVICEHTEVVEKRSPSQYRISKNKAKLDISSELAGEPVNLKERIFNLVPGFEAIPLKYRLKASKALSVKLNIGNNEN